ncbi:hypothetical protein E4U53_007581 [Claviceps sorghi]|nr:hypothetical protein E4U53_007581 [Claviceps sorghi]
MSAAARRARGPCRPIAGRSVKPAQHQLETSSKPARNQLETSTEAGRKGKCTGCCQRQAATSIRRALMMENTTCDRTRHRHRHRHHQPASQPASQFGLTESREPTGCCPAVLCPALFDPHSPATAAAAACPTPWNRLSRMGSPVRRGVVTSVLAADRDAGSCGAPRRGGRGGVGLRQQLTTADDS